MLRCRYAEMPSLPLLHFFTLLLFLIVFRRRFDFFMLTPSLRFAADAIFIDMARMAARRTPRYFSPPPPRHFDDYFRFFLRCQSTIQEHNKC